MFSPAGGSFGTYAGTFTMTAPNRKDFVTGTYLGKNDSSGDFYGFVPFSGVLTITGGRANSTADTEVPASRPWRPSSRPDREPPTTC